MVHTVTKERAKNAGSRRIFSPLFKLQVLDSYRRDADCQGNQRATARKYGIHRRQIQKWLQMEANLRLSVQQRDGVALNLTSKNERKESCQPSTFHFSDDERPSLSATVDSTNSSNSSDSDEYVNVDEISDSEDDLSTCSSNDKALDFTTATLSKRRFYTTDFKLHVIDAFKHDKSCMGNQRATARKFGIHRRQVQKWLNHEHLYKCGSEYVPDAPEHLYRHESEHLPQPESNVCLDLSNKRKMDDMCAPDKRFADEALCLVKHPLELYSIGSANIGSYSAPIIPRDYPMFYPWSCCYPQQFEFVPHGSCSFDYKSAESSYVDVPVQYGFRDVPKLNDMYARERLNNVHLLSYR